MLLVVVTTSEAPSFKQSPPGKLTLCVMDKWAFAMIAPLDLSLCYWQVSRVPPALLEMSCDIGSLGVECSSEINLLRPLTPSDLQFLTSVFCLQRQIKPQYNHTASF